MNDNVEGHERAERRRPRSEDTRSRTGHVRAARAEAARHRRRVLLSVLAGVLVVGVVFYVVWTQAPSLFAAEDATGTTSAVAEEAVADFPGPGAEPVQVTVDAGATPEQVGAALVDAGVVASVDLFVTAYDANPDAASIQPGTYNLFREMKASDAVAALLVPDNLADFTVEVKAGLTASAVVAEVSRVTGTSTAALTDAFADTAATGLPAEAEGRYEGWLSPGVYHFALDAAPAEMIHDMVAATVTTLDGLGVAPEDRVAVLTKASLVEKETPQRENLAVMASLVDNRLAEGMTLDLDSTVRYALQSFEAPLSAQDREVDHEYNTYKHAGLPPSAISTVSPEALQAVLAPADTSYLYVVVVDPVTKETQFSTTYTDYQKSLMQLQSWLERNS